MRELKSEIIHLLAGLVSVDKMVAVSDVCDKFQSRLDASEALKPSHNIQSTAFLSREEFRDIAVKHGVDYNVAIGLYWDVKNAAHL